VTAPPTRVVVAEDIAAVRGALTRLLEGTGRYAVVAAVEDGPALVVAARAHDPELVITDLAMPGGDGIPAIGELRRALPALRIVVYSAHDGATQRRLADEAGADAYCLKGAPVAELLATLDAVAGG
jgi:two-component system, NarL family, response regulator DesR